ncbi:hypothetical protein [Fimbriiglobus ruber]|uniref:Uncharacterized protein n=1 Tax=Fimbriiglobus ruber TaxID=1908690 RepID=A0A225D9W5_9BACT|nr:hypothetical protein [Fimbriiglobus ruber]OWK38351.1 hypothetical protein FRUB_07471 [Fimbriiglobus ruber]
MPGRPPRSRRPSDRDDDRDDYRNRDDELDGDVALTEPSDETFWKKYSARLEMPTSALLSVLYHALVVAGLIAILYLAMSDKDKKSVPISLVQGGEDDAGDGSPGSGGVSDPLAKGESTPLKTALEKLPQYQELPEVEKQIRESVTLDDPNGTTAVPEEKAKSYAALNDDLRKKLLGVGQQKGEGPGAGKGNTGQEGAGPGGTGASSTRARSIRWILRFRTASGRDYVDQLRSLNAVILVPVPPDNKAAHIFRDLVNPRPGTMVTEAELARLSNQIQFSDPKPESVEGVRRVLGLDFVPNAFWAFFPKDLEAELARLEVTYRNRRPEDIEVTYFQVTIRNGQYQLVVDEQRAK